MQIFKNRFIQQYEIFASYLFLGYVFLILSFGRPVSIFHFQIGGFPVFTTEIVLLFCLPLAAAGIRQMFSWSRPFFLCCLSAFFLLGMAHLGKAIFLDRNPMALRDIVLCVYMLFLPVTLRVFSKRERFQTFLILLIMGNIIALVLARFFVGLPTYNPDLFNAMRTFNFGLYFGIGTAFLLGLLLRTRNEFLRIFLFILLGLNIYMIFMAGSRSSWAAFLVQAVFLIIVFRRRIIPFLPGLIISVFFVFGTLGFVDFYLMPSRHTQIVGSKFQTVRGMFKWIKSETFRREEKKTSRIIPVGMIQEDKEMISRIMAEGTIQADKEMFSLAAAGEVYPSILAWEAFDLKHADEGGVVAMGEAPVPQASDTRFETFASQMDALRSKSKDAEYNVVMSSFYWRLRVLEQSLQFGMEKPVWGQGYGVYPPYKIYNSYTVEQRPTTFTVNSNVIPAHNHLATIFYKMGFVGLGLFVGMNFYVFNLGISGMRKIKDGFLHDLLIGGLAGFVFWHVLALWFDVIDSPPTTIFLWILMGLILAVIDLNERTRYEEV